MALTKTGIVDALQRDTSLNKKECADAVEILLETMKQAMESGEDVLISGFGRFCLKEKKKRRGRNPATGDSMMLEPRRVVTFRCSGKLKGRVNGGYPVPY
jgi:integration host factor subunit alpha